MTLFFISQENMNALTKGRLSWYFNIFYTLMNVFIWKKKKEYEYIV